MNGPDDQMLGAGLSLCWSLWAELGVSAWVRSHGDWAIELEPLIVLTSVLGPHDPRLLRESAGWCADNEDLLSVHQLRHIVRSREQRFRDPVGRFGATVAKRSARTWPGSQDGEPYEVEPGTRSQLRSLEAPALLQLRLRSLFGVSARAEIVRVLLNTPREERSAAEVSSLVAYTHRQVTSDLDALRISGLIRRREAAGRAVYALREPDAVLQVVGPTPEVFPRWTALTDVLVGLLDLSENLRTRNLSMPSTEVARRLRSLRPAIGALRMSPPAPKGQDADQAMQWARGLFTDLAAGDPSYLLSDAPTEGGRR